MKVTAGVCAYNEEKSLGKALESVLPQLGPDDELVVVASGCTDRTAEIARGVAKRDTRVKVVVEAERGGKAAALNKILGRTKSGFLVLTDADVALEPGAVREILKPFADPQVGAAIGCTESWRLRSFWDRLQDFAWRSFNGLRRRQSGDGSLFALNGYLSAVRAGLVTEIPRDSLVEDWALGWAVKAKGYRVVFCPEARVRVKAAQNLRDYLRQKVRVRVGQLQLKEQGMGLSYVRQPENLGLLFGSPYALPYLVLDLVAWALALARHRAGILTWEPIASSKP